MALRSPRPALARPWRRASRCFAVVAAACSDPPTSGGDGVQAAATARTELPDCPLDALDEADGPGRGHPVVRRHRRAGQGRPWRTWWPASTPARTRWSLTASDQGSSYAEVYRKFESAAAANTDQLPDIVYLENTQLQALADSGLVLPAQACMEADGYDLTDIEPAVRSAYSVDDVLYPGYMNVSSQVLYYNKAHWVQAGLDPDAPPQTLDEVYEQAKALKDAGVSDKPLSFKVSHAVFENWLSGDGVDVVNNDNGRDGLATEATFDTPEAEDILATAAADERRGPGQRVRQHRGRHRPLPGAGHPGVVDADRDLDGVDDHRRRPWAATSPPAGRRHRLRRVGDRPDRARAGHRAVPRAVEAPGQVHPGRRRVLHRRTRAGPPSRRRRGSSSSSCSSPRTPRRGTLSGGYLPDRQGGAGRARRAGVLAGRPGRRAAQAGGRPARRRRPRRARPADRPLHRLHRRRSSRPWRPCCSTTPTRRPRWPTRQDEVTESLERYEGGLTAPAARSPASMRRARHAHA